MYRIIYNTLSGKIETCRRMSDSILEIQLQQAPDLAYINGFVQDNINYRVDLDTLEVVSQPNPFDNRPVSAYLRERRNIMLQNTDWTQASDSPLSASKRTEWATYRQALRDLPSTQADAEDIQSITWPTRPE